MRYLLFFISIVAFAEPQSKKSNLVKILVGGGPGQRFNVKTNGNLTEVKSKLGLVYGVGYDRRVEQTSVFVGGQLQSNGTALLSVGAEF